VSGYITISRVFDAPRELVYQAFADPDQLSRWFGPEGCSVPRDTISIDARVGGRWRFVMVAPEFSNPIEATFTEVVENELLACDMQAVGVPGVDGVLRSGLRLEFHDEGNGKTRLELRQGPFATDQLGADTTSGWLSSFTKLDALLCARTGGEDGTQDHRVDVRDAGR
jgi:uncharacterized protein YndB with AHSA1/START domain